MVLEVIIETNGNNLELGFESLWGYKNLTKSVGLVARNWKRLTLLK